MTRIKSSIFIAAALVLYAVQGAPLVIENDVVCNTLECHALAGEILTDMDSQADPSVDFSAFACGGYDALEEIPAYRTSIDAFDATVDQNMLVIRYILEPASSDPSLPLELDPVARQNLQKLRDLYSSCMNEDQLKELGRKPLLVVLHKIIETLPVSNTGLNRTGLSLTLSYFNKLGLNSVARFAPAIDMEDPSQTMPALLEGGVGLNGPQHYLDPTTLNMYASAIANMFGLMMGYEAENGEPTMATVTNILPEMMLPSHWESIAQQVVDFEKRLVESFTETAQLLDPVLSYNVRSMDELSRLTPSIDWGLLLDDLLPADVKRNHSIVVVSPSHQERLEVLLHTTEPRTLQAYFVWTAIRRLVQNLDPMYDLPLQDFEAAVKMKPAKAKPDRWMQCVEYVNWNLGHMGGYFFMAERYKDGSHELVTEMVDSLRSIYETILPSLSWLDPSTTAGAFEKLKALVILVGFSRTSPDGQSSESLRSYYEDYLVDPGQFFENDLQYRQWWSAGRHAFDDLGRQFDGSGRQVDSNFTITTADGKERPVDSELTLNENIADNGGARQAFAAWQTRFMSDLFGTRHRNFQLPGLENYTPEQLFYISFGRSWCKKMRPDALTKFAGTDSHSPHSWRINGALQNSDQFAWAFQCPVGSPMNPPKKCQLW
ncbi:unnamed protein product [Mortierella alpina]